MEKKRCPWCLGSPLYKDYHDNEWGVPVYDDQLIFESLMLESQQAGLSWITILKKREGYRRLFENFDPSVIAGYNQHKVEELVSDPSIIRHRKKIEAIINNAHSFLKVKSEYGSFTNYIWTYVDNQPIDNQIIDYRQAPAQTPLSNRIAKDLKSKGFKFMGPTTTYAFMQAIGMVNDHEVNCYRYQQIISSYQEHDNS